MKNLDLEQILPHKYPMILIDNVIDYDLEKKTICTNVEICEDKIFFDKSLNGISPAVGIEFMAQTIGCYSYFKHNKTKPKIGFLLGTRIYENSLPYFENGKTYEIRAKEVFENDELVSFECFIYNDGEVCSEAVVNVYMPKNEINLIGMLNV